MKGYVHQFFITPTGMSVITASQSIKNSPAKLDFLPEVPWLMADFILRTDCYWFRSKAEFDELPETVRQEVPHEKLLGELKQSEGAAAFCMFSELVIICQKSHKRQTMNLLPLIHVIQNIGKLGSGVTELEKENRHTTEQFFSNLQEKELQTAVSDFKIKTHEANLSNKGRWGGKEGLIGVLLVAPLCLYGAYRLGAAPQAETVAQTSKMESLLSASTGGGSAGGRAMGVLSETSAGAGVKTVTTGTGSVTDFMPASPHTDPNYHATIVETARNEALAKMHINPNETDDTSCFVDN